MGAYSGWIHIYWTFTGNLGLVNTFYTEGQNQAGTETYNKTSLGIAIGLRYSL